MKFFLDTANIDEIREAAETGLIDGVTTNPSLVAKEKRPFEDIVKEICQIVKGPTSAEVIATDYKAMMPEAEKLAKISEHVVIKVPLTRDGLRACKTLREQKIPVNVTLCFSANQALLAAKAGATYISPFIGRLDDIGQEGMALISEIADLYASQGFSTQILAASIRHTEHIRQAALLGAQVATMPYKVFEQLYHHPLTDSGLQRFLADWKKTQA
ncbi:MAG: fructose-6-phosphate aldolase [Deltaproteobacteria bacterium CG11_big_fil_rev_8_21_14_0_20_45_16]|nr:MAG: fructose-6-phosphate aldolase [Deltaproteobacteria bacterium CG11_big_fil_rev_8_21_14_0_20_45_16]